MNKKLLPLWYFALVAFTTTLGQPSLAKEALLSSKPTLLLAAAKQAADACEAMAKQRGLKLSIAIVDEGTHLILFRRMPGSSLGSVDIAMGKAQTAVRLASPTRGISEYIHGKNGQPGTSSGVAYLPGIVTLVGGLPIKVNQQLVGGIGVSGASGDNDEACGQAALDSLKLEEVSL